jgi:hypothetical protein
MSRTLAPIASLWFIGSCAGTDGAIAREPNTATHPLTDRIVSLPPNGPSFTGTNPIVVSLPPNGPSFTGTNPIVISLPPNGPSFSGVRPIFPISLPPNGKSFAGTHPIVISLPPNGSSIGGIAAIGAAVSEPLIAIAGHGVPLSGSEIVGSTLTGRLSDGGIVELRIEQAVRGTGANADVWSYRMSASVAGAWQPLCVERNGAPGFADTVPGTWNVAQGVPGGGSYHADAPALTLACRGSTIAKCVELGYKPWTGHATELAACVRALRADYCGDGSSHTVEGTRVNLFDDAGVRDDAVDWVPEAEWTADGASCISDATHTRSFQLLHREPTCASQIPQRASCGTLAGSRFRGGTKVITELSPP